MNTRAKGFRTVHKAIKYAKAKYPKAYIMTIYQPTRFATPAPFDLIIFDFDVAPRLIEVRANQWGTGKPQTKTLAWIPGVVVKEIWRFRRGELVPDIRRWDNGTEKWERVDE